MAPCVSEAQFVVEFILADLIQVHDIRPLLLASFDGPDTSDVLLPVVGDDFSVTPDRDLGIGVPGIASLIDGVGHKDSLLRQLTDQAAIRRVIETQSLTSVVVLDKIAEVVGDEVR